MTPKTSRKLLPLVGAAVVGVAASCSLAPPDGTAPVTPHGAAPVVSPLKTLDYGMPGWSANAGSRPSAPMAAPVQTAPVAPPCGQMQMPVERPSASPSGAPVTPGGPPASMPGMATSSVPAKSYTVSMASGMRFSPATLTVPVGSTVVWTNDTPGIPHTSTSDTGQWDSGTVNSGQSYSRTFSTPGTYPYHCTFHQAAGMVGTITVQ